MSAYRTALLESPKDEIVAEAVRQKERAEKAEAERDYAINEWVKLANADDVLIRNGYRSEWKPEELLAEARTNLRARAAAFKPLKLEAQDAD